MDQRHHKFTAETEILMLTCMLIKISDTTH